MDAVIKFFNENPEGWPERASNLVQAAIKDAFPYQEIF